LKFTLVFYHIFPFFQKKSNFKILKITKFQTGTKRSIPTSLDAFRIILQKNNFYQSCREKATPFISFWIFFEAKALLKAQPTTPIWVHNRNITPFGQQSKHKLDAHFQMKLLQHKLHKQSLW
jgi:hypothetical protein